MIETKRKEELSVSYLNAVCACAGIAMEHVRHDEDGVDCHITKILQHEAIKLKTILGVQLKSTSQVLKTDDNYIYYPLKSKNYNDFTVPSTYDMILCVLVLPKDEKGWLSITEEELIMRKCMYWTSIKGQPTENVQTVTIRIPKSNLVTSDAMQKLLEQQFNQELP